MRGWLLDIYPDYGTNSIVYWVRTRRGAQRIVDRSFLPQIFVHASPDKLDDLEKALPILDAVKSTERVMRSTWLGEREREVLAVTVQDYAKVEEVAHTIVLRVEAVVAKGHFLKCRHIRQLQWQLPAQAVRIDAEIL